MKRLPLAMVIALAGIGLHFGALALADRLVPYFPTVPDIIVDRLPLIPLFVYGEVFFILFLILYAIVLFGKQREDLAYVLTLVGLFYGLRAIFLLFLPIGGPLGSIPPDQRPEYYPHPEHSFFPGGHHGLLILFALTVRQKKLKTLFLVFALLFSVGTLFAKTHYTVDLIAAGLLVYALKFWADRSIRQYFVSEQR